MPKLRTTDAMVTTIRRSGRKCQGRNPASWDDYVDSSTVGSGRLRKRRLELKRRDFSNGSEESTENCFAYFPKSAAIAVKVITENGSNWEEMCLAANGAKKGIVVAPVGSIVEPTIVNRDAAYGAASGKQHHSSHMDADWKSQVEEMQNGSTVYSSVAVGSKEATRFLESMTLSTMSAERKSVLDGSAMVTTQKDLSTPPDVEENSVANYSAVEKEADVGGRRQQLARWSISDCAKHFRNTCYLSDTIKEHSLTGASLLLLSRTQCLELFDLPVGKALKMHRAICLWRNSDF